MKNKENLKFSKILNLEFLNYKILNSKINKTHTIQHTPTCDTSLNPNIPLTTPLTDSTSLTTDLSSPIITISQSIHTPSPTEPQLTLAKDLTPTSPWSDTYQNLMPTYYSNCTTTTIHLPFSEVISQLIRNPNSVFSSVKMYPSYIVYLKNDILTTERFYPASQYDVINSPLISSDIINDSFNRVADSYEEYLSKATKKTYIPEGE